MTGSGLIILMLKKLNWFCLTGLITLVLLMWKWIVELSLLNWIGALTLSLLYRWLLKLPPRKLGSWFLDCISINLPNGLAWNTVVISGLLHLIATWNCKINFKNGYLGRLVLHLLPYLLPLLNPGLIVEMTFLLVLPWMIFIWTGLTGSTSLFLWEVCLVYW